MKKIFGYLMACIFSLGLMSDDGFAQSFQNSFSNAYRSAESLGEEVVQNRLELIGLLDFIWVYNNQRVEVRPAGYESDSWFSGSFLPVYNEVRSKLAQRDGFQQIPDQQLEMMRGAFESADNNAFADLVDRVSSRPAYAGLTTDEAAQYLAIYASLVYQIDPGLWEAYFSITGFWPLCAG